MQQGSAPEAAASSNARMPVDSAAGALPSASREGAPAQPACQAEPSSIAAMPVADAQRSRHVLKWRDTLLAMTFLRRAPGFRVMAQGVSQQSLATCPNELARDEYAFIDGKPRGLGHVLLQVPALHAHAQLTAENAPQGKNMLPGEPFRGELCKRTLAAQNRERKKLAQDLPRCVPFALGLCARHSPAGAAALCGVERCQRKISRRCVQQSQVEAHARYAVSGPPPSR